MSNLEGSLPCSAVQSRACLHDEKETGLELEEQLQTAAAKHNNGRTNERKTGWSEVAISRMKFGVEAKSSWLPDVHSE